MKDAAEPTDRKKEKKVYIKHRSVTGSNMHKTVAESGAVLIKPTVDASDKELHFRNQFNYQAKNLEHFIG